jgi:hypothetical protein
MPVFRVNVCRISYGNLNIDVEARNIKEAKKKAENKAGDFLFTEHTSEYKAQDAMLLLANWLVRCYNKKNKVVDSWVITGLTEKEAYRKAEADIQVNPTIHSFLEVDHWTLTMTSRIQ